MKLALTAGALALVAAPAALAQTYPTKPIRLVVGFTPGGGVDINARLFAPKLSEYLGQQIIVENRPGAGTNIANEHVARSAPDGYTTLINTAALVINMSLYPKLNYDARDLAGVAIFSTSTNILVVHASVPVKTVKELVALARSRPGALNYSSSGAGTTQHLTGELFNLRNKIKIVHVPFRGTAPSLTALISGEVDLSFANIPAIHQHVISGRLRPLASTGPKRAERLPDVPTMREAGIDMEVLVWYGMFVPRATPREIVNKLADAMHRAATAPEIQKRLREMGAEPGDPELTPEAFDKYVEAERAQWAEVVKASGAKAN
ncbi:MAG TPA: tripartite tricarboxylate transporter substrate binding protein [Burkholderiales bacterium]